jgi:hypothetical protein
MEAQPDCEISIANPLGLLAVATFINSKSDGKAPIAITSKPIQCFDDKQPESTVKLVRSKEYLPPPLYNISNLVVK